MHKTYGSHSTFNQKSPTCVESRSSSSRGHWKRHWNSSDGGASAERNRHERFPMYEGSSSYKGGFKVRTVQARHISSMAHYAERAYIHDILVDHIKAHKIDCDKTLTLGSYQFYVNNNTGVLCLNYEGTLLHSWKPRNEESQLQ